MPDVWASAPPLRQFVDNPLSGLQTDLSCVIEAASPSLPRLAEAIRTGVCRRRQLPRRSGERDLIDHLPHTTRAQERLRDALPSRLGVIECGSRSRPHFLDAGIDLLLPGRDSQIGHFSGTLGEFDYIIARPSFSYARIRALGSVLLWSRFGSPSVGMDYL